MGKTSSRWTLPWIEARSADPAPVVLIAGATASGKSGLAVALAQRWEAAGQPCRIVNCDSAQVYRDLRIVSARPDAVEMGGIEHRLFGYIDGAEACSAARWATDARAEIMAAHEVGILPILVGGTGLYIRTLLDGIAPIPQIAAEIRAEVRAMNAADAHAALAGEDPESAGRLNPGDTTRVQRALEVVRSTGIPLGQWQHRREGGIGDAVQLFPLLLLPPRDWLVARCERRFAAMLEQGAMAEVAALLERRLDPDLPVMRAIGVPEIASLLRRESDREMALEAGQIATRRYAKRQYTWFSNQPPGTWPRWLEPLNDSHIDDIEIKLLDYGLTS